MQGAVQVENLVKKARYHTIISAYMNIKRKNFVRENTVWLFLNDLTGMQRFKMTLVYHRLLFISNYKETEKQNIAS